VRDALEAVSICEEDLQCARNLHSFSKDITPDIEKQIRQVQSSVSQKRLRCRSIWDIPDEVWLRIFELVPMSKMKPYDIDIIIITRVCSSWRRIVRSHSPLCSRISFNSWVSIDKMVIPVGALDEVHLLTSISSYFTGLQTLEISGDVVDMIMAHLDVKVQPHGKMCKSINLPSLNKLIITDYGGRGDQLHKVAEERHVIHHHTKYDEAARKKAASIYSDRGDSDSILKFIEWHFDCMGFGPPSPEIASKEIRRDPSSPSGHYRPRYYKPREENTVNLYAKQEQIGVGSGYNIAEASLNCFKNAVEIVINKEGERIWKEFIKDVEDGKDGPTRLFNIELRNCLGVDPDVLRRLKPYMQ
jgi:hypothetical protein